MTKKEQMHHLLRQLIDLAYDTGYYSASNKYKFTDVHTLAIAERNLVRDRLTLLIEQYIPSGRVQNEQDR